MTSARRLYRLQLALAALGAAVAIVALGVALTRVDFRLPSLDAVAQACRATGLADPSLASLAVLLLSSVAIAVIALAGRSAVAQTRAHRRFLATLAVSESTSVAGRTVHVVDDARQLAFCGGLFTPRVYVSRGTVALLAQEELEAVVAHEAHHASRRDPLRIFVARAVGDALFFLPVLRRLAQRYAALAEVAADEAAIRHSGSRGPLAAALLAFDAAPSTSVVGIAPERVDCLLGARARWELPVALLLVAGVTLAGLFALAVRTAEATAPASVEMPVLLAQACMVATTVTAALAGAAVLLASKRAVGRRRA